jgi:hypothetical protein
LFPDDALLWEVVGEGETVEDEDEDEDLTAAEEVLYADATVVEEVDHEVELEDTGCTSRICSELKTPGVPGEAPGTLSSKCMGTL